MERRKFIRTTGLVTAGVGLSGNLAWSGNSCRQIKTNYPAGRDSTFSITFLQIRMEGEGEQQAKTILNGWPTGDSILCAFRWLIRTT